MKKAIMTVLLALAIVLLGPSVRQLVQEAAQGMRQEAAPAVQQEPLFVQTEHVASDEIGVTLY